MCGGNSFLDPFFLDMRGLHIVFALVVLVLVGVVQGSRGVLLVDVFHLSSCMVSYFYLLYFPSHNYKIMHVCHKCPSFVSNAYFYPKYSCFLYLLVCFGFPAPSKVAGATHLGSGFEANRLLV